MRIQAIAVFTDFSENANIAVDQAFDIARRYEAELSVVHVVSPVLEQVVTDSSHGLIPQETKKAVMADIEERMAKLHLRGKKEGVTVSHDIIGGHVSTEILSYIYCMKIDLAILGAFGLSGMGLVLFGSVAKRVAHRAPCSVMIVRDKEKPPA